MFANSRPSALNFKSFSRSLEQFFLTVGQNNFGNKIPIPNWRWILQTKIRCEFIKVLTPLCLFCCLCCMHNNYSRLRTTSLLSLPVTFYLLKMSFFWREKKTKKNAKKNDGNNSMTSQEENINVAASSVSVFSSWNKSFLTTWQILIYSWEYLFWLLWWLRLVFSEVNWFYFVNFSVFFLIIHVST